MASIPVSIPSADNAINSAQGKASGAPAGLRRGYDLLEPQDRMTTYVQAARETGPVRTVITANKIIGSGELPLVKGRGLRCPYEASNEYAYLRHLEMHTAAVAVLAQPYRSEGVVDGRAVRKVSDVAVIWADGTRGVYEVKSDGWRPKDDHEAKVIAASFLGYRSLGFEVGIITPAQFANKVRDRNVDIMFVDRFSIVTERHKAIAARVLREGGGHTTMGELARAFGGHHANACAVIHAMHVRRLVEIDLLRPLGLRSHVKSVPRLPAVMPNFRL